MNAALWFLFWRLTWRKALRWFGALRQPGRASGVLICLWSLGMLFHYRDSHFIRELVEGIPIGLVLVLAVPLSLIRGLMQKGLHFDAAEIEYLCCRPISQRTVLIFRLIPSYFSALCLGVGVYGFLGHRFAMPGLVVGCVVLTHVLSIHLTMKASLYGATISDRRLGQLRRGLWWVVAMVIYAAFRWGTGWERAAGEEALNLRYFLSRVGVLLIMDSSVLVRVVVAEPASGFGVQSVLLIPNSSFLLFGSALVLVFLVSWSFGRLLPEGSDLYEPSLRKRIAFSKNEDEGSGERKQIERVVRLVRGLQDRGWFYGARAYWWKNLLCARRSLPSVLLGFGYTLLVVVPWLLLVATMRQAGAFDEWAIHGAIPLSLAGLPLLLQTTLPFDLRLDGHQLSELKRLPLTGMQSVVGILGVPILLSVLFQLLGLLLFCLITPFSSETVWTMLLGFPAVAVGVNAVWNLYYLLYAVKQFSGAGKPQKRSTVGTLFILGLACAVFFPSCWLLHHLVHSAGMSGSVAGLIAIALQYAVDGVLLWLLARAFSRHRDIRWEVPS